MRIAKTLVLAASLAVVATATVAFAATAPTKPSPAEQDWYSVEILVFRYTGPDAAQGELWPRTVPAPSLAKAVDPSSGKTQDFLPISQTSTVMSQSWQRLENASGYAPVLEVGWMQPGYDTKSTRPVSLTPIPATAASTAAGAMTSPIATASPNPVTAPSAQSTFGPAVQAEGTATLAVADNKPYIQLNVRLCEPPPPNLELEAPTGATASSSAIAAMTSMPPTISTLAQTAMSAPGPASAEAPTQARQCFALHQSHQVTPGQLQYFDTAAFGVLALVNPIKTPAAAATAPQAAHTPD